MTTLRVLALTGILLLTAIFAAAQELPNPEAPPPDVSSHQKSAEEQEPMTTIRSQVNVVNLFFNVKGPHNALIPGLTKDDFQVFEDGKPQTIKYFSANSDQPLTLGLLVDTSGSESQMIGEEQDIAGAFLRQFLRPNKDMAFLISFDINVDLLQDLTSSVADLRAGLRRTRINTGGGGGAAGIPGIGQGPVPISNPKGTLLYDAVYLASHDELAKEVGRKAIILLTDGSDQGSTDTLNQAIEAAQKADAIVYVLLIWDPMYGNGGGYMEKLTGETGGRVIEVGRNGKKLQEAFDQISNELRSQYSIGYTPINARMDGTFRRIEIKTTKGYKVQSRKGYYALAPQE